MPSLKDDSSFKEFISLGAVATEKVIENLNDKGHNIIELERGALSSRMWEHKEKRLRVPDLLCLNCGRRIESRGKKSLEIKMSHSTSDDERTWDYDAKDRDWVALVKCYKVGERSYEWEKPEKINVVSYEKLRETKDKTKTDRGGRTQGSELTIEWASTTASADGKVKRIKEEDKRIQISRASDNYTLSYSLEKKIDDGEYVTLEPLVDVGEFVKGEEEIIAAPFELVKGDEAKCDHSYAASDFTECLDSDSFNDRFSAVKALGYETDEEGLEKLKKAVNNTELNIFVRIESAASLAKQDIDEGWNFLEKIVYEGEENASERLETAIILGEIANAKAQEILRDILKDDKELEEIRAEAAHSLGYAPNKDSIKALTNGLATSSLKVKKDCISSLSKNFAAYSELLENEMASDDPDIRMGCAIALAESDSDTVEVLKQLDFQVPEEVLVISLGLVNKSQGLSGLSENTKRFVGILSNFFNSWADIMTEDIRYNLRKKKPEGEKEVVKQKTLS